MHELSHTMTHRIRTFTALAGTALALAGCSAAVDDESAALEADGALASEAEPMTSNSPLGGGPGTVEIEFTDSAGYNHCTGVAIGPNAILTAGHCFDAGLGKTAVWGYVWMKIHYVYDGTTFQCISSDYQSSAGRCTTWEQIWVDRLAPSPARGSVDATLDFALLTTPWSWRRIDTFADIFTYQRTGDSVRAFGAGSEPESHEMRYFDDKLDWVGSDHVIIDAGTRRVCHGDSGGPIMRMNWYGYNLVTGTLANHEGTGEGDCATSGAKQRFHRITNARVDWINSKTNWIRDYGQPACYDFATINGTRAAYRCF